MIGDKVVVKIDEISNGCTVVEGRVVSQKDTHTLILVKDGICAGVDMDGWFYSTQVIPTSESKANARELGIIWTWEFDEMAQHLNTIAAVHNSI